MSHQQPLAGKVALVTGGSRGIGEATALRLADDAGVFVTGTIDAEETDWEAMDRQYAVNVAGAVAVTRAATKVMGEGGRIVSVGSTSGDRTPFPGLGDYSATKAALTAYTRGPDASFVTGATLNVDGGFNA